MIQIESNKAIQRNDEEIKEMARAVNYIYDYNKKILKQKNGKKRDYVGTMLGIKSGRTFQNYLNEIEKSPSLFSRMPKKKRTSF